MTTLATPDFAEPLDAGTPLIPGIRVDGDEAAARRALRTQIGSLDRDLSVQQAASRPRPRSFAESLRGAPVERALPGSAATASPRLAAPRLLTLAELEAQRDALADRVAEERARAAELADRQDAARCLREEILLDPAAHPYARVTNAEMGEPGCHDCHVRPRFGLLGMLMRWWRVHISSGCP
jgi:hypothetical protein